MPGEDRIRALLIDDDPDDYVITRDLLLGIGTARFDLDWARTYEEAILKADSPQSYDVCLLDYHLGRHTGLELLEKLLQTGFRVPAILLTGNRDRDVDIRAMKTGAADYLTKGEITAGVLERSIRYAIQHTRTVEALRASEERYALAIQGAKDGLWDWDLRTGEVFFSARWKSILGYRDDELENRLEEWFSRVHPDDLRGLKQALSDHLEGRSEAFEREYRMLHRNGEQLWIFSRGLAVRNSSGEPDRMTGSQTDITLRKLAEESARAEETAALHFRTIEALVLAIEARDTTTYDHLQRVQLYALALGEELGLGKSDIEAIRAASLLHDIGKLAVPEHIISKPGKLTPREFERMKVHPVVGAEILERVQFPYPVVPIVRHHHERWDGQGYPAGLAAAEIPIGARILAAVDCLDALATDRQYRRAMPLDEAMRAVRSQSGKAFDPNVVEVLERHYLDWEKIARSKTNETLKLSTDLKIESGKAPAAGFEKDVTALQHRIPTFSPGETEGLYELSRHLGQSASLDETLSIFAVRLKGLIPYDSLAVYLRRGDVLVPGYASDNLGPLNALKIPVGQGLSGWVAEQAKPIVNGNPAVEWSASGEPTTFTAFRSALSVPLKGANGILGAITLYRREEDAFLRDHLQILITSSSTLSLCIDGVCEPYAERQTIADIR